MKRLVWTAAFCLTSQAALAQVAQIPTTPIPNAPTLEVPIPGASLVPGNVLPEKDYRDLKPLMVVRFNQKRVYFERALNTTVNRAQLAKPDTLYDVVSVLPQPRNGEIRYSDAETAKQNQIAVVNALRANNVGEGRIRQHIISDPNATAQEVRLFVQ